VKKVNCKIDKLEKFLAELRGKCDNLKGLICKGQHYEGIMLDLAGLKEQKTSVKAAISKNQLKLDNYNSN